MATEINKKGTGATMESPSKSPEREVVLTRIIDEPRERVFQAWTDPKLLSRWWGPRSYTAPTCEMDPRVGGAYRLVMRSPDGVFYPIKGVIREFEAPERLALTADLSGHPTKWHDLVYKHMKRGSVRPAKGPVSIITATFEEQGRKTRLAVWNLLESIDLREAFLKIGMTRGWEESLDRLEELLKGGPYDKWRNAFRR